MSAAPPIEPSRLVRDELAGDLWTLNFGPQHPATHTTLRLVLELDGETVVACTPHIGYLHSGFEKLGEHLNYNQYVVVTDRMNYISPMANNIAWHHACEKLFGLEITPRCKAIRTIIAELARIQDHLLCVGTAALDLGAFTAFLYGFNEREIIYDLFEEVCGARFTTSFTRVGGLMYDIPDAWPGHVKAFLKRLQPALADLESLLTRNRIFIERTRGIGVLSHDDAIAWGWTGPLARASGVRRDLRKDEPYLCYADNWDGQGAEAVQFLVPIATGGDVYSRYLVRLEEIRQSAAIIRQLVDRIPPGPVNVLPNTPLPHDRGSDSPAVARPSPAGSAAPSRAAGPGPQPPPAASPLPPGEGRGEGNPAARSKVALPDKREVYFSIEGLIHHFETIMTNRGFEPPIGECYGATETANGELGFYLASDGANCPYRARCRPPSFINYQVFPKLVIGHQISDVVAVLGSLNIIAAELDR